MANKRIFFSSSDLEKIKNELNHPFGVVYRENADGATVAGEFYHKIVAAENSVISYTENYSGETKASVTVNAGVEITGKFDEITVNSGGIFISPGEILVK